MGLFDLFRRKPKPDPDPMAALDANPVRCHHYALAHVALRQLAHDRPLLYLGALASPDADKFLAAVFADVANHCRDREPKADFGPADVTVHKCRVGGYPCAVIEMPAPRGFTEAFFTAAVLLLDGDRPPDSEADVKLRYFTLENGFTLDAPRTVLCEWTADGTHLNFGDGPEPTLPAFVAALEGKLAARREEVK